MYSYYVYLLSPICHLSRPCVFRPLYKFSSLFRRRSAPCLGSSLHLYLYCTYKPHLTNCNSFPLKHTVRLSTPIAATFHSRPSREHQPSEKFISSFLSPQNLGIITISPALSLEQPTFTINIIKPNSQMVSLFLFPIHPFPNFKIHPSSFHSPTSFFFKFFF